MAAFLAHPERHACFIADAQLPAQRVSLTTLCLDCCFPLGQGRRQIVAITGDASDPRRTAASSASPSMRDPVTASP